MALFAPRLVPLGFAMSDDVGGFGRHAGAAGLQDRRRTLQRIGDGVRVLNQSDPNVSRPWILTIGIAFGEVDGSESTRAIKIRDALNNAGVDGQLSTNVQRGRVLLFLPEIGS